MAQRNERDANEAYDHKETPEPQAGKDDAEQEERRLKGIHQWSRHDWPKQVGPRGAEGSKRGHCPDELPVARLLRPRAPAHCNDRSSSDTAHSRHGKPYDPGRSRIELGEAVAARNNNSPHDEDCAAAAVAQRLMRPPLDGRDILQGSSGLVRVDGHGGNSTLDFLFEHDL